MSGPLPPLYSVKERLTARYIHQDAPQSSKHFGTEDISSNAGGKGNVPGARANQTPLSAKKTHHTSRL